MRRATLGLLSLALGCSAPAPAPPEPPPPAPPAALDDGCAGLGPADATPLWLDADGDGWGDDGAPLRACVPPPGTARRAGDCDDRDPARHPGAAERCNTRDDDCDGQVDEADAVDAVPWYSDADGDGWGDATDPVLACQPPPGRAEHGGDCYDGDPARHPEAPERCDGRDDDCDGQVDAPSPIDIGTWLQDADGDGFPGHARATIACQAPAGFVAADLAPDCDDGAPGVHPGAPELCDGVDDDCDGQVDEDDAEDAAPWYADTDGDGQGDPRHSLIACRPPRGYVSSPFDCDDLRADAFLGAVERCNGRDDDCDGQVDEDDAEDARTWYADTDGDGFGDAASPRRACRRPEGFVPQAGDCDDTRAGVNPGAREVCDRLDDDCDGQVDEPDADDAISWYRDADRDGHGDPGQPRDACDQPEGWVSLRGDCDDGDAAIYPGAGDPPDGIDNDCDGAIDEDAPGG
ncbi:MAG: putative metal-binding motif-containing protein [Pseudomonadota bacterium]